MDTNSDVSFPTISSASNVLLLTHPIGNPTANLDPYTSPPLPPPYTTQPSTSHSP